MSRLDTLPFVPAVLPVTDEDIRAALSRHAYDAGRRYLAQGRVRSWSAAQHGFSLVASVQGSERKPYRLSVRIDPAWAGTSRHITGTCSCPVGYNCKHVAAALLAAADPAPGPPSPAPLSVGLREPARPALPADLALWLEAVARARDSGDETYPATLRQRIVYVLSLRPCHGASELVVVPMRVHLRKDGTRSDKVSRYNPPLPGPAHEAKFLRPSDRLILRRLVRRSHGGYGLTGEAGTEALRQLIGTGRACWERIDGVPASEGEPRPARVVWRMMDDGRQSAVLVADEAVHPLGTTPPWYACPSDGRLGPLLLDLPPAVVTALIAAPPVPPQAVAPLRAELERRFPDLALPAPASLSPPEPVAGPPVPHLELLAGDPLAACRAPSGHRSAIAHMAGAAPTSEERGAPMPLARLGFRYGPVLLQAGEPALAPIVAREGRLYQVERSRSAEQHAVRELGALGLERVAERYGPLASLGEHRDDYLLADDDPFAWLDLIHAEVPRLRAEGWTVEIEDSFPFQLVTSLGGFSAELVEHGIDWFELHLGTPVDGERVDLAPALVELLRVAGPDLDLIASADEEPCFLPLPDGRTLAMSMARLRPILVTLRELLAQGRIVPATGRVGFSRLDAAELAEAEAATAADIAWSGAEQVRELGTRLREASTGDVPPAPVPSSLAAQLRPYQRRGVDWLQHLARLGSGAVLADDMGLGKTVQALAHLVTEKAEGRLDRPALVVCPTSLVPNWRREAARFAPELEILVLHGPDRSARFDRIAASDLVITTYPLLARDAAVLAEQPWHAVVLDEAQTIKNPDAATTRLALGLTARQRLCLSGTPLENHLGELWSLFSFAVPGLLGDRRAFRDRFRTPIERHGDAARGAVLARRVRPFLLRRTKAEVEADLPAKTEIVEAVELGDGQRAVYEGIRLAMHARVRAAIAERGLARSGIVVLDALLKLRQACCDPRLLRLEATRSATARSSKLERLMELVPTLVGEGRRILLFSQFTSMLALIEADLAEAGIPTLKLTGRTRDRDTPVGRFQAGEVPVFLISLKAGGTGLTLTAADTVIHYDPWWNPAVEDQATDRAHRIGQDKAVFVYKLVTLGTVEEKMEVLKATKRALAAGLFASEGEALAAALNEADVEALFSSGPM